MKGNGSLWRQRKGAAVAVLLFMSTAAIYGLLRISNRPSAIPAFDVKRDEFVDTVQFRGDVKAMKSVTVSAPSEAGELQILKIATSGAQVKKGDMIVEFDRSKTQQDMAKFASTLKSAQAETEQVRAQSRLTDEEDITAVTKAHYDVELATLDASKQEIVSKIEGAEANLKVVNAQQKLHEVEGEVKGRSRGEPSEHQQQDRRRQEGGIRPGAGTALADDHDLACAFERVGEPGFCLACGRGSSLQAGERVWPGAPVAELPDVSTLRVEARVDEAERGRLAAHQPATVQLDAIPDRQFTGRLEQIGTIATMDFSGGWPIPRNFNLQIALAEQDKRLKPGMTAQITVVVDRVPNAITIPVQASFQKSGQTVAYVADGSKFREQPIEVSRRSRDRILVSQGLREGDRVALEDPTVKE